MCSIPFKAHALLLLTLNQSQSSELLKQSELMWLQLPDVPVLGFAFVILDVIKFRHGIDDLFVHAILTHGKKATDDEKNLKGEK